MFLSRLFNQYYQLTSGTESTALYPKAGFRTRKITTCERHQIELEAWFIQAYGHYPTSSHTYRHLLMILFLTYNDKNKLFIVKRKNGFLYITRKIQFRFLSKIKHEFCFTHFNIFWNILEYSSNSVDGFVVEEENNVWSRLWNNELFVCDDEISK